MNRDGSEQCKYRYGSFHWSLSRLLARSKHQVRRAQVNPFTTLRQ